MADIDAFRFGYIPPPYQEPQQLNKTYCRTCSCFIANDSFIN